VKRRASTPPRRVSPSHLSALGLSGLRRTRGGHKGAGAPRSQCHSDEEKTAEPGKTRDKAGRRDVETESEGAWRAISAYPKGRRGGGKHLGFPECVLLRGRAWERRPWPARMPSPAVSQKEPRGAAQRRTLQVFRGSGLVTRGARQGCEEGSSRNARALRSALSARVVS